MSAVFGDGSALERLEPDPSRSLGFPRLSPISTRDWTSATAAHLIERAALVLGRTSAALAAQALEGTSIEKHPERILVVKEWLGYDDTAAVLKGRFDPMNAFA